VQPETQYARSGEVHIAYQVVGEGKLDLVWIPSLAHHVELSWENPPVARFLVRIAELGRLVVFDKRGTGMSDRVSSDTTLETRMDDIRAVMDAAGSERAVVCALGEGGPLAMLRRHLSGANGRARADQLLASPGALGRVPVASPPRRAGAEHREDGA
jgi:pimeloyl-ACP methyl ester carboxylesterase